MVASSPTYFSTPGDDTARSGARVLARPIETHARSAVEKRYPEGYCTGVQTEAGWPARAFLRGEVGT
eukprot:9474511-Pyramimonas_sp.AAC.1